MKPRTTALTITTLLVSALTGCSAQRSTIPPTPLPQIHRATASPQHWIAGFEIATPRLVAVASRQGIGSAILYGRTPEKGTPLADAFVQHGMTAIDGGVSSDLFYWECHRTHTVAPPPKGNTNDYCATDEDPKMTTQQLLSDVAQIVAGDARRPYVVGYWVLDDWAWWDPGSGRGVLAQIHRAIVKATPNRPAICGFGAGIGPPGKVYWDPGTAKNYSNGGCDWVGWYNYSPFGRKHPGNGAGLDWSMKALLPAMAASLQKEGWNIATHPLLGINQAWGGPYGKNSYQPGLTANEMQEEASAFCAFGAQSIAWYSWDDSGFKHGTETPVSSPAIAAGIAAGLAACKQTWGLDTR